MPGIRIHHPDPVTWGRTILIPHPGDPTSGRKSKDYVLRLDPDGNIIVSETVWQRLQEARDSGLSPHQFIVLNEVPDPPAQHVGRGPDPHIYRRAMRQVGAALQEIAPPGIQPRIVERPVGR